MTDLLTLWPELADVPAPELRPFRAELRRIPGPVFKAGPRGTFRAHVLRCGLCQGWSAYTSAELACWTWDPRAGTAHARCVSWRDARAGERTPGRREVKAGQADELAPLRELPRAARRRGRRRRAQRARGVPRTFPALDPWTGPELLATPWGDELIPLGARAGGVLVAPAPELRGRRIASGGRELVVRYVHQAAPRWWRVKELGPAR